MKKGKPTYEPRHLRKPTRIGAMRDWIESAPVDALWWLLGVLAAEVVAKVLEPEIAALASLIRDLIGP